MSTSGLSTTRSPDPSPARAPVDDRLLVGAGQAGADDGADEHGHGSEGQPGRQRSRRPPAAWSACTHASERSSPATRWVSTKPMPAATTARRWDTVPVARPGGWRRRTAPAAGRPPRRRDHRRKAAQSARKTPTTTATAAASRKPGLDRCRSDHLVERGPRSLELGGRRVQVSRVGTQGESGVEEEQPGDDQHPLHDGGRERGAGTPNPGGGPPRGGVGGGGDGEQGPEERPRSKIRAKPSMAATVSRVRASSAHHQVGRETGSRPGARRRAVGDWSAGASRGGSSGAGRAAGTVAVTGRLAGRTAPADRRRRATPGRTQPAANGVVRTGGRRPGRRGASGRRRRAAQASTATAPAAAQPSSASASVGRRRRRRPTRPPPHRSGPAGRRDRRRSASSAAARRTARCSEQRLRRAAWPAANPESMPSAVMSRTRSRRGASRR